MRRLILATATLLSLAAAPAFADELRDNGGRGFDPSGADAEMLLAATQVGQLVNENQASVAFQTQWYAEHGQNVGMTGFSASLPVAPAEAAADEPAMPLQPHHHKTFG